MDHQFSYDPIKERPVSGLYLDAALTQNYELPMQILFQLEITRKIMIFSTKAK